MELILTRINLRVAEEMIALGKAPDREQALKLVQGVLDEIVDREVYLCRVVLPIGFLNKEVLDIRIDLSIRMSLTIKLPLS